MNNAREHPAPRGPQAAAEARQAAGGDEGQPLAEEEAETQPGTSGQAGHCASPESPQHQLLLEPPAQGAAPGLRPHHAPTTHRERVRGHRQVPELRPPCPASALPAVSRCRRQHPPESELRAGAAVW